MNAKIIKITVEYMRLREKGESSNICDTYIRKKILIPSNQTLSSNLLNLYTLHKVLMSHKTYNKTADRN